MLEVGYKKKGEGEEGNTPPEDLTLNDPSLDRDN
jgi:hypothetical protein